MRKTLILARRELAGYFLSPTAYVIAAIFVAATAFKFIKFPTSYSDWFILVPGNEASLRPLFEAIAYVMIAAAPLLTMRLLSEEYRSGTMETLRTSPITDTEIVLGKFLGTFVFYLILLALTGVYLSMMAVYGQPDYGVAATGYIGLVLLGAAYIAVGVFASSMTSYQVLAAVVGIVLLGVSALGMPLLVTKLPTPLNSLAANLGPMQYFKNFSRGVIDTRGIAFFLSLAGLFLYFSVKTLESKRWR